MKVVDFFCGAGGFSEGFRQAGFDIVLAVDNWKPAVSTFKANNPNTNVLLDDVVRISKLSDSEFERLIPDTEVIIGSPPCVAFSHSNKSGKADKTKGIELIIAFFKIVARKKFKENSKLKFWVLENVPKAEKYIKEVYTAKELGLKGDFVFYPKRDNSGVYNAKYFGAPTNRKRFLCGMFPALTETHDDNQLVTLGEVLNSLHVKNNESSQSISDINYPGFSLPIEEVTDHHYVIEVAQFEWETAKRLKQDKGYMGRMSFPENLDKPSRTVMATMSTSSRESMILGNGNEKYRLPTIREVSTMMSFPIDYRFYGNTKGIKHTLVGNSVPPKLSYAIAQAILNEIGKDYPNKYIPIMHDPEISFVNLNYRTFPLKTERPKRDISKFKYHIPYLILSSYRVELTNYHSNFETKHFVWKGEIHYSQGKSRASVLTPIIDIDIFSSNVQNQIEKYVKSIDEFILGYNEFQAAYCMTTNQRATSNLWGPFELLHSIRQFIDSLLPSNEQEKLITITDSSLDLPLAIAVGYFTLTEIIKQMGNKKDGF